MTIPNHFGWMSAGVRVGDIWRPEGGGRLYEVTHLNKWSGGMEVELTPQAGGMPFFVPIQSLIFTYERVG